MGYEVHVTRAETWFDSETVPIGLDEWLAYVASDPELRLDNAAEAGLGDDGGLRYEKDGLVVWTAYSHHGEGGNMAWLDYRDGRIVVKNPDEEMLAKLCQIASCLAARVQGDDGETYPGGSSAAHGSDQSAPAAFLARPLRAIRNLFRRGAPLSEATTKFEKGQRYRYLLGGGVCTVVAVDPKAEHGLGVLTVRFDDGRQLSVALVGDAESMFLPSD